MARSCASPYERGMLVSRLRMRVCIVHAHCLERATLQASCAGDPTCFYFKGVTFVRGLLIYGGFGQGSHTLSGRPGQGMAQPALYQCRVGVGVC